MYENFCLHFLYNVHYFLFKLKVKETNVFHINSILLRFRYITYIVCQGDQKISWRILSIQSQLFNISGDKKFYKLVILLISISSYS
jgi:hypothetical protein